MIDVERLPTRPSIPSGWALHSAARSLIGALTEGDRVRRKQNSLIMGMTVDWDRSVGVSQSHGSMAAALIVTLAARDFLRLAIAASRPLDRSRARLRGSRLLARSLSCNHPRIRYAVSHVVSQAVGNLFSMPTLRTSKHSVTDIRRICNA